MAQANHKRYIYPVFVISTPEVMAIFTGHEHPGHAVPFLPRTRVLLSSLWQLILPPQHPKRVEPSHCKEEGGKDSRLAVSLGGFWEQGPAAWLFLTHSSK